MISARADPLISIDFATIETKAVCAFGPSNFRSLH